MDGVWNISSDFHSCYHRFNQISSNWPLYNSHWSHLQENTLLRAFLFYLYINLYILFYLYPPIQHGNCSFNFPTAWEHQDTESSALSQQEELGNTKHMQKLNWETQAVLCIKKNQNKHAVRTLISLLCHSWYLCYPGAAELAAPCTAAVPKCVITPRVLQLTPLQQMVHRNQAVSVCWRSK